MSALFPTYPKPMIHPIKGKGAWLFDEEGKEYLDFTSGIGVCQLGHAPELVKKRVIEQMNSLWHTSNLFVIEPQNQLAQELTSLSGLDYAFFANSGAEANEGAIKLARRYQQKVKGTNRYEIITFKQSFHGRTLATLTATGQEKVKDGFLPLPDGFVSVDYNDISQLRKAINDKTAAIMLEVIQGEGGIISANAEFLEEVERLAKENDILIIIDEVQTGIGRTGKWFGFQNYLIKPDIITLAKGLGSGFPIGAVLGDKKTKEAFNLGSHGSTFGGNFLVTTAALATIEEIKATEALKNVKDLEVLLFKRLVDNLTHYPDVVQIRGTGFMVGIEWKKPISDLILIAKNNGLLVLSAGPNVLRLLPPLNITKAELEQGLDKLFTSINAWLQA